MKKLIRISGLVIILFLFKSCTEENPGYHPVNSDYFVFGHFYGMCMGENCIEIFKIEGNKLYEDTLDKYPSGEHPYDGKFVLLDDQKYKEVAYLKNIFPAGLLQETNTVKGMPDAGDWGGLYVEIKINGVKKFWLIDKMRNNVPDYLHPFEDEIEKCIDLLK